VLERTSKLNRALWANTFCTVFDLMQVLTRDLFVYLQNQNERDDIATVGVFFYAVKVAVRPTQAKRELPFAFASQCFIVVTWDLPIVPSADPRSPKNG